MKLPIQAQPINRQITTTGIQTKGINPSNCGCGSGKTCYGICVDGNNCLGVCA